MSKAKDFMDENKTELEVSLNRLEDNIDLLSKSMKDLMTARKEDPRSFDVANKWKYLKQVHAVIGGKLKTLDAGMPK